MERTARGEGGRWRGRGASPGNAGRCRPRRGRPLGRRHGGDRRRHGCGVHDRRRFGAARWARFTPPDWGPMPPELARRRELAALRLRAERLRARLDEVQTRIDSLEGGA